MPAMSHFTSPLGFLLVLALYTPRLIEARPVEWSHQGNHGRGPIPNPGHGHEHRPSHWHTILYIQISDDGQVSKSEHRNDYTLMDIQFTSTGILIKGRKSARYLCSHTNSTLYSTFQLTDNCRFKEGTASNPLSNNGNLQQRSSSGAGMDTACLQSGQIDPNLADPLGMIEC